MISFLLLLSFAWNDVVPMKVNLGDPQLPIQVTNSDGNQYALADIFDEGMCFLLAPGCPECDQAIVRIMEQLFPESPCIFLFLKEIPETYQTHFPDQKHSFFSVTPKDLKPFDITTFPALLLYQGGQLKYAYHGVMDSSTLHKFLSIYRNH